MTGVDLKTSLDVFGQKVWVAVVLGVFVALHPHERSNGHAGESDVQENDAGEELPSIGWLLVSVVSVFEVAVVESVDLFSRHKSPITGGFCSDGVKFWIFISELWCLRKRNEKTFVVIVITVGVFEELFVLLDRHLVAWVVDVVFLHGGGGYSSEGQGAADCHAGKHFRRF